jgi:hypothetical protein|tara:strand:- start:263 stop:577 length:315 start_codon:yes stop_codon:yes gene_type:complete
VALFWYNSLNINKERKNVMKIQEIKYGEVAGWVGLGCLQFNSVPAIISSIETGSTTPLGTIYLTLIGLVLYLIRSLKANDTLYTVGNTIGLVGNFILLATIWWV